MKMKMAIFDDAITDYSHFKSKNVLSSFKKLAKVELCVIDDYPLNTEVPAYSIEVAVQ